MAPQSIKVVLAIGLVSGLVYSGFRFDYFSKGKCEWYLVPEEKHKDLVQEGWVALCARNYRIDRQKCYLSATVEVAEAVYGKPVIYDELVINEKKFPREISRARNCKQ
jgi:hypothetical protein